MNLLAEMIVCAKSVVFFTGAGISTACGIPDYRSGFNTVLPTGPGCWETAANQKKFKDMVAKRKGELPLWQRTNFNNTIACARPSKTHMAMLELINKGHVT